MIIKILTNVLNCISLLIICSVCLSKPSNISQVPDMCDHYTRFGALTQYKITNNSKINVEFFLTSGGYYWTLKAHENPSRANSKGPLPNDFRGDAAYFREWNSCDDPKDKHRVIVVVDNDPAFLDNLKHTVYFINNHSFAHWTSNLQKDPALKNIYLYNDLKSVDAIINLSNIKTGPFKDKLGAESIFVFTTAYNGSSYYDWVRLNGCVQRDGTFNGTAIHFFGGLLERAFWKMNKPVDTAMVYTQYPINEGPQEADISWFQENSHIQLTVPLELVANGLLYGRNNLLVQYYSTWLDCAPGGTPEPPVTPIFRNTKPTKSTDLTKLTSVWGQSDSIDNDGGTGQTEDISVTELNMNETTKLRLTIPHEDELHDPEDEDNKTFETTLLSVLMVLFVLGIIIVLSIVMVWTGFFRVPDDMSDEESVNSDVMHENSQ